MKTKIKFNSSLAIFIFAISLSMFLSQNVYAGSIECTCYTKSVAGSGSIISDKNIPASGGMLKGTYTVNSCDECNQMCYNVAGEGAQYKAIGVAGGVAPSCVGFQTVTKTASANVQTVNHTCSCDDGGVYPKDLVHLQSVNSLEECKTLCAKTAGALYMSYDQGSYTTGKNRVEIASYAKSNNATSSTPSSTKKLNYTLLESFPGFFTENQSLVDLPALVLAIYKFGIWTVGIAGLFMLVIGGFMYMASAGNTSSASSAQGIITDSLIGIVAALGAYLILYVINPDLTKINLDFTAVSVNDPIGLGGQGGKCTPVTKTGGYGTVEQLSTFGTNATKASSICKVESGGDPDLLSGIDKCQDGYSFSVGLFQINMIDSAPSICNASGDIFTTGTSKGSCLSRNSNGDCNKWSCKVKDVSKYNACVTKLKDPTTNINIAKQISNIGSNWSRWGANNVCKF